jgi:hypothetical protein
LVVDDMCSFLNKRLITELSRRRVAVVGVFDPEDGEAVEHRLAELGIDVRLPADAEPRLDVDLATKRTCDYLVEHLGLADRPGPQVTVIVEPDRVIVETTGTVTLGIAKLLLIGGGGDPTVEIGAKAIAALFRLARSGGP